jgi:hypothetical protein
VSSRRRNDAAKAKQRKQRIILVVLAVVFAGLLAFQLPKLLSHKQSPAATAAPVQTTTTTAPVANPPGQLTSDRSGLGDAVDVAPAPQEGQLIAFGLFKSKDPFVQQLGEKSAPDPTTTTAEPPATSPTPPATVPPTSESPTPPTPTTPEPPAESPPATEPTPTETTPTVTAPTVTTPAETTPTVTAPTVTAPTETAPTETAPTITTPTETIESPTVSPAVTAATISVNGVTEDVTLGAAFPAKSPLFRFVSAKDDIAQLSIVGGSLQDGSATVPLAIGKPLTLMNTADGTRFVVKLLALK